jgi:hypothetical protein
MEDGLMRRDVTVLGIIVWLFGAAGQLEAEWGPGPHWVDSVDSSGTLVLPSALVEFGVDFDFDGVPDLDVRYVGGPIRVAHTAALDDSFQYPGTRPVDGHLDVADTEIVSMTLPGYDGGEGTTLRIGSDAGVSGVPSHADPWPSLGAVAELSADPALAESFFEVFLEVDDVFLVGRIHNDEALRLSATIDRAPPPLGTDYLAAPGGLPLALYNDAHTRVAQLTNLTTGAPGHFMIIPEPSGSVLAGIGLLGLLVLAWRSRRNSPGIGRRSVRRWDP